jgi:hypothetical protein
VTDNAAQELLDRADVSAVMHRYCTAIDTKDWALLASCFTEDVEADFRSFGGRAEATGRDAWVAGIKSTIAGLDATQHLTGNHVHQIDGDKAKLRAYIQAVHMLQNDRGDPEYTIGGWYDVDLTRTPDGWRIHRYTLDVRWHRGNRGILRMAARKAG